MGLDVYVGSLTRYYTGDWETVVQRLGREQGLTVQVVRPEPKDASGPASGHEVQGLILQWRDLLNSALSDAAVGPLVWNESVEAPYFTNKPAWDCYGALLLWAAYREHPELDCPRDAVADYTKDAAYQAANDAESSTDYPNLLRGVEWWFPTDFPFTFQGLDPTGREAVFGSSAALVRELQGLNDSTWQMDAAAMVEAARHAPARGAPLETSARFTMGVLWELAGKSVEHSLPMKLDY